MSAKSSAPADPPASGDGAAPPAKAMGKGKLLLIASPVAVVAILAGLWFGGLLPKLLGGRTARHPARQLAQAGVPGPPVFAQMPDIVANLNAQTRREVFLKLKVELELPSAQDAAAATAAMPRLMDLMQTYLRDMRPEELRGAAGTYRLREELLARANIAVAPAHVSDVLFEEMFVQ